MERIRFGTDGWRARIAEDFTFDNVRRCAQGYARYLAERGNEGAGVVVGYDRRFAAEHFGAAVAEVMAANGFHVWLTEAATPTPVVAYSAVERKAAAAVIITASHNPPWDCGFKVHDSAGAAVASDGLAEIEAAIPPIDEVERIPLEQAQADGRVEIWNPSSRYIEHLGTLVEIERLKDAGLDILVEPMWGSGAGWLPRILGGSTTRVTEIHSARNPIFPEMVRPEPIRPNVDAALQTTVELGADVCLIVDGDACKMGIVDEEGEFLNQLQVAGLLGAYFLQVRGERGAIVKTLSSTMMLEELGRRFGVEVHDTGIGPKFVGPRFIETDAILGAAESGGYMFRGNVPERDGILGNLYFLDLMVRTGKSPSRLLDHLYDLLGASYHYRRVDTRFPGEKRPEAKARLAAARPKALAGLQVASIDTLDGHKYVLADGKGWLLVRFSGTEPVLRVYCETTDEDKMQSLLDEGLKLAGLA